MSDKCSSVGVMEVHGNYSYANFKREFAHTSRNYYLGLRGQGGGPRPWDGQKSFLMLVLKRARRATRCFLPDQKILILAKVIAGSISQNTYNYIAVARFNRE